MPTNRAPFDYVYLSRRLLTYYVQSEEAAKPRTRSTWNFAWNGLGLNRERRDPDYENLPDLAARSTEAVSDWVGPVEEPAEFVRDTLDLRWGIFQPHMGWPEGEVACYCGTREAPDVVTFLAMFGSASNMQGRIPTELQGHFYPSDIAGLYQLLDLAREPEDPEIDLNYRTDDYGSTREWRTDRAVFFATKGAVSEPQPLEFLAKVFEVVEQPKLRGHNYARVVVGTPLWISTPRPAPPPEDLLRRR